MRYAPFTFERMYARTLAGVSLEDSKEYVKTFKPRRYAHMEHLREELERYAVYSLSAFCDGQVKSILIKSFEATLDGGKCEAEVIHDVSKVKVTLEIQDPVWAIGKEEMRRKLEKLDNSDDVPESDEVIESDDDAGCCC